MKKHTILISVCLAALLAAVCLFALPAQVDAAKYGDLTYTVNNGEATITNCSKSISGELIIPDTVDGYPVTAIGDSAFYYCTTLNYVTIPDSVTTIGNSAFYYCSRLYSVTIGDGVTTIGSNAFYYCYSLGTLTIGNSVTTIGDGAFYCCAFDSVSLPDSVTAIGAYAFYECARLTSVTIPDGVTTISENMFVSCTKLASVTIPDSITSIGVAAFYGCTSLTRVTIPDKVTTIGESAFYGCSRLTSVTIPDSVTIIGQKAFRGCALVSVRIPDNVTTIGPETFENCTNLTSVIIGNSVTEILNSAFYNCTRLNSVYIPSKVLKVQRYAFGACTDLQFVYYSGTRDQWKIVEIESENDLLTYAQIHYETAICDFCDGEYIYCSECNAYYYQSYGSVKNHSFKNYISNNDATTETDGTKTAKCDHCDATDTIPDPGTKIPAEEAWEQDGNKLTLLTNIASDVAIDKDTILDLNGFDITGTVTVANGCTLYCMDSKTDDYTVNDRFGYGKLKKVVGNMLVQDGYLMITEADGFSFHRVSLQVTHMTLRPQSVGIYFKSAFAGDEVVAQNVLYFGVALSAIEIPDETNLGFTSQWSRFDGQHFSAGANVTSTLLAGIMKTTNDDAANRANAGRYIYGRTYIQLKDGSFVFGATVQRSLQEQVEAINTMWTDLTTVQQDAILQVHSQFASVMNSWNIPAIIEAKKD